jgi:hypothetical protein
MQGDQEQLKRILAGAVDLTPGPERETYSTVSVEEIRTCDGAWRSWLPHTTARRFPGAAGFILRVRTVRIPGQSNRALFARPGDWGRGLAASSKPSSSAYPAQGGPEDHKAGHGHSAGDCPFRG